MEVNTIESHSLNELIYSKINTFLKSQELKNISNFYDLFLSEIEPPLLEAIMSHCKFNQVRAAKTLGISRGTLRKKLRLYFNEKYCGTRIQDVENV